MRVEILVVWNADTLSGGIHSKRLFSLISRDKGFLFVPTTPADWKLKHWNPLPREHDLLTLWDGRSIPALPGNKILQVPCISGGYKRKTLVILFRNLVFLQHTLHYWILLHNNNSYLCFACLFSLSRVHRQVFVDKISRDGCSTYCQLMFLVANCWENKEHAVEIFIENCSYEALFTKTWG